MRIVVSECWRKRKREEINCRVNKEIKKDQEKLTFPILFTAKSTILRVCECVLFDFIIIVVVVVVVATFHKWFQSSVNLCVWCVFQIKEHNDETENWNWERHSFHFSSIYECECECECECEFHKSKQTQFEREDWERGYRTLIGIFVPTHFHQLCKFLWTFSRNLWCQSFITVLCILCVHNKSKWEKKTKIRESALNLKQKEGTHSNKWRDVSISFSRSQ
jgi:hypothetical protein